MIDCQILDRLDDYDVSYFQVGINSKEAVLAMCTWDSADEYSMYIRECPNGTEVYLQKLGSDHGVRELTDEERQAVFALIKEQMDAELEM